MGLAPFKKKIGLLLEQVLSFSLEKTQVFYTFDFKYIISIGLLACSEKLAFSASVVLKRFENQEAPHFFREGKFCQQVLVQ